MTLTMRGRSTPISFQAIKLLKARLVFLAASYSARGDGTCYGEKAVSLPLFHHP